MSLDNRAYDGLKWGCLVLMPALAVLLQGMADLYGWPGVEQHVALLNMVTVFLGTALQLSSYHYHHDGGPSGPLALG